MHKILGALISAAVTLVPSPGAAAMAGANTVNSAAIVDGSVANVDLANKAVTAGKIADGTITATQIAAGAVTSDKIGGTISTSKLPIGSTSTTVAAGDHTHGGLYLKKYAYVLIVAKSGGDFTDPVDALNSISDASVSKPYLVKIMPGVYDIANRPAIIKDYVSVEGSGRSSTRIVYSAGPGLGVTVVQAASHAEIRAITLESNVDGGGAYPLLLAYPVKSASVLSDVALVMRSGGTAIRSANSSLTIGDVSIEVTGGSNYGTCLANTSGSVAADHLDCQSSAGFAGLGASNDAGGTLVLKQSSISASDRSVSQGPNGGYIHLAHTQLLGGVVQDLAGTVRCIGVYDAGLSPVACP